MNAQQGENVVLRHEKFMDEVSQNIWLGQFQAVFDEQLDTLQKHQITHVVSIGCYHEWWETRRNPKHLLLPLQDTPFIFITDYFDQVFRFMESALNRNQGVLVHCEQGRSRSGAMVIAFLMKKTKKGYPEVLNKVLMHRKKVMPNIGFQIQLRAFGKQKYKTDIKYAEKIDIKHELSNALRNLQTQVSTLHSNIKDCERFFITVEYPDDLKSNVSISRTRQWKRVVQIGLTTDDLATFRKEWVLLVFLCHQFHLYKIAAHKNIIATLNTIGEMYFEDLLETFSEVFNPMVPSLIMDYNDPIESIDAAIQIYKREEIEFKQNARNSKQPIPMQS